MAGEVGIAEDHRLQVRQVDLVAGQAVRAGQAAIDLDQADAGAQALRHVDRTHHRREAGHLLRWVAQPRAVVAVGN
eukprot:56668-Eustigmatos_ZCMA.PRE.1